MDMVNMSDLSSLLQLAAGLNLAGAAVAQFHRSLLAPDEEYLQHVRSHVLQEIPNEAARHTLKHKAVVLENVIFKARLESWPVIKRLVGLNIAAGAVTTGLLALPAFGIATSLPTPFAAAVSIGVFVPIAVSLAFVRKQRAKWRKPLDEAKDDVNRELQKALEPEATQASKPAMVAKK